MLKIIGQNAFYDSEINQIVIPSNVTKICENAFNYCQHLNYVVFEKNSKLAIMKFSIPKKCQKNCWIVFWKLQITWILGLVWKFKFDFYRKKKNAFNGIHIKCIVIPSSVVYINEDAFIGCENLQLIEIGEGSKLKLFYYNDFDYNVLIMVPPVLLNSIWFMKSY